MTYHRSDSILPAMKSTPSSQSIGKRYGKLTVIEIVKKHRKYVIVSALCDCGKTAVKRLGHMRNGTTSSCGCIERAGAGSPRTRLAALIAPKREYRPWETDDERYKGYENAGGPGECWVWIGSRSPAGYGALSYGKRVQAAHRVAWERANGAIPLGLCVLHKCDNPPCVNPSHLFLGTRADNIADCIKKGRFFKPRVRLNDDAVRHIRISTETQEELAKKYGVAIPTINHIKNRKSRAKVLDLPRKP